MAKRSKQLEAPGTERQSIQEIADAADAYVAARDERAELSKTEDETRKALEEIMRKHKLEVYRDPNGRFEVTVKMSTKAKVRALEEDEADDDIREDLKEAEKSWEAYKRRVHPPGA